MRTVFAAGKPRVLGGWTVARTVVRQLDERIVRLVADSSGTRLYSSSGQMLVCFVAAAIEIQFASDGLRERNALEVIRVFTGHEIDLASLTANGTVTSITITREDCQQAWNQPVCEYKEATGHH